MPSFLTILQNPFTEKNIQTLMKLKLQLFPIDEVTRRALEMVGKGILFYEFFMWNEVFTVE